METNKEVSTEIEAIKVKIEAIKKQFDNDVKAETALKAVGLDTLSIKNAIERQSEQITELENLIISLESESAKVEASELMKVSLLNSQLADQTIIVNFTLKTEVQLNAKGEEMTNKNGDKIYHQICLVSFGKAKTVTLTAAGKRNLEAGTQMKNAEGLKIWADQKGKQYYAKSGADLCKVLKYEVGTNSANRVLADNGILKVTLENSIITENTNNIADLKE